MPAQLPGFYWDETRNRYFPLSSRPKEVTTPALPKTQIEGAPHRRQRQNAWQRKQSVHRTGDYMRTLRQTHQLQGAQYASTSKMTPQSAFYGNVRVFHSTTVVGETWRLLGDDQGWLYSDKNVVPGDPTATPSWTADLNLLPSCPISSISASGGQVVSTCLGPGKITVQDLTCSDRTYLLNLNKVSDIRASHIQGNEVVLGARTKVVYIPDVDNSSSAQHLRTNSDTFTVLQKDRLIYAGTRNGSIERFDIRISNSKSQRLFDDRFGHRPRSSVLCLEVINDHDVLLSHLNGDLCTFDLRFSGTPSSMEPLQRFTGHVNTYTENLGFAMDPNQEFVFAAGQDCRIRAWSLRTTEQFLPPVASHNDERNPLAYSFSSPVTTLQVTDEPGAVGLSLWAGCRSDLYHYSLGQQQA